MDSELKDFYAARVSVFDPKILAFCALTLIFTWAWRYLDLTLNVDKLPNLLLDTYVLLTTRGLPVRYQIVRGQGNIHETRGSTFIVKDFWSRSMSVYTVDPANIQTAWSLRFDDWEAGPIRFPVSGEFIGRGLTTTDKARWMKVRTVAKNTLAGDSVVDFLRFKPVVDKYVDGIDCTSSSVDLQPVIFDMYWEACFVFLMGRQMTQDDLDRIGCSIKTARLLLDDGVRLSKIRSFLGPFKHLYRSREWSNSCKFAESYTNYVAEEGYAWASDDSADHDHPTCLMHRLALNFDRDEIRNEILHYMIGTLSTVAGLVTHACQHLAQRPDLWRQLHDEVNRTVTNNIGESELSDLKSLDNVFREVLRLYPSAAFSARMACRDTVLPHGEGPDGHNPLFVPENTRLNINVYALQRTASIYGPNPDVFEPDRWNSIRPQPWEFLSFGRGKRSCLGKEKGIREAKYILFRLASRFVEMKPCGEARFAEVTDGLPKNCLVELTPTK